VNSNLQMNYSELINPTAGRPANIIRTFFVASTEDRATNLSTTSSQDHPQLIFGTKGDKPNYVSITKCSTKMTYIDAQIFCTSKGTLGKASCGVNSVRAMLNPTDSVNLTFLESGRLYYPNSTVNHDPGVPEVFMGNFMDLLNDKQSGSGASSIVEWYIKDPLTALNNPATIAYADLGELDIMMFEQRLALLWNTLWKIGYEHASIMGGDLTRSPFLDTLLNTTSTTTFPLPAIYALDIPWIILYFVSVAIMFFAAVFSLVMHHQCHAPSILGYVSSLIRDSKYFNESEVQGNSAEDGTGKTKRLGYLKVMLADTKSDEDVGKIAFAPASTESRVRRRRWYE
jgi:hypothetical protein